MKYILRFAAITVLVLSAAGCFETPKEPVMPSWDVEINVPLVNKEMSLVEIIDSSNNPNITLIDSAGVYDSLYFLVVDDLNSSSPIQDTLKIPVALAPDTLSIQGPAGAGEIRSATIFNPDPDYHLYSAKFKKGRFILDLNNNSNSTVNIELVLPGFKTKDTGEILSIKEVLNAGQIKHADIDLGLYNYKELTIFPGFNDMVNYNFQGAPGFYFVGIATASGNVDLDFKSEINSDEITISRMTGQIKRTELAYFETEYDTKLGSDIKQFRDRVKFKDMRISLGAETVGELKNMKIVLDSTTVTGYKKLSGGGLEQLEKLNVNGLPYFKADLIAGVPFSQVFDTTNSNITDVITSLPGVIKVGNRFVIDKSTQSADSLQVISAEDSIKFFANIIAPLAISSRDAEYSDTVDINLSQDDRDQILKASYANLTVEVTNATGLGVIGTATFMDANYNKLFSIRNTDGSTDFVVNGAEVNGDGIPIAPSIQKITLELNSDEFQKFTQAQYVEVIIKLRSFGSSANAFGPFVRVRAKDYIKYNVYGGVKYLVDPESNKN